MRKTFLIVAVLAALAGCSPGTDSQSALEQAAQSQLPEAPPPDPDGTPDPVFVQKLVDAGADPDEARALALTTWNYTTPEPGVLHMVMTYPWGDTTRIELRLSRVDAGEVGPAVMESSIGPGQASGTIQYYVPEADLPGLDTVALLQGPGARFNPIDLLIPSAHAQASGNGGFAKVVQSWFTETASDEIRDKYLEASFGKAGGKIAGALNVAKAGQELQGISDQKQETLDEIDKLRKCTEDNPGGVQWQPGEREKILKQMDELREAIVADLHVIAANTVASTAAGMQPLKVLGVAASLVMAMTSEQLQQLINDRMDDIRKSVSKKCGRKYAISGCDLKGDIADIEAPFQVAGPPGYTFHFSGGSNGTWGVSATGMNGNGPYNIELDGDRKRGKLRLAQGVNHMGGQTHVTTLWVCDLTLAE